LEIKIKAYPAFHVSEERKNYGKQDLFMVPKMSGLKAANSMSTNPVIGRNIFIVLAVV